MTYKELRDKLLELSEEQLNCNLTCELVYSEECFSSTTNDFRFDIAGENNSYLDYNHPVFVLQY